MYRKNTCFLVLCSVLALVAVDAHAVSSVRVLGMPSGTSPVKPNAVRTGSAANAGANMAPAVKKATSGSATASIGRSASKLSAVSSAERISNAKPKINVKSVANPGNIANVETQQIVALGAINDKVSELEARVNDINMNDYYTQNEIEDLVSVTLDDYDMAVDEKIDARLAEIESVASVENISAIQADTEANTQNIIDNTNQINELRDSLAATNALLEKTIEKTEKNINDDKVNNVVGVTEFYLDDVIEEYLEQKTKKQSGEP